MIIKIDLLIFLFLKIKMEDIQLTKENLEFTKELFRKEDLKPNFFFIQDDLD